MKRMISILLITALLMGLMPIMATAVADEYQYAVVTSENGYKVRLREGPSKAYDGIGMYPVGTTVIVLQNGTTWSQVKIGDKTGWMMSEFLIFGTTGGSSSSSSPATGTLSAKVISNNGLRVWLRATAGGKRLFLNAAGTNVSVLERGKEWCRVSINGTIGYMMTKYLSIGEKVTEAKPVGGKVTSVALNYRYPTVLDTLSVTITPADAEVKYSWQVQDDNGTWVERGNEATFEVLTSYARQKIRCKVTGTGVWTGSATATSAAVQISRSLSSVALSDTTPVVGDTLKAILQPSSAQVEYSWRVGGVEMSDAETYTVEESDIGKMIQLKVTGINGYAGSTACSADEVVVSNKKVQSVKISDTTPVVGQKLTATVTPSGASVKYAWTADGETVSTSSSYTVTEKNLGKKIRLTVTGKDSYEGTASALTENVAQAALKSVSVKNSAPMIGDTIYATLSPSGATAKYTWYVYSTGSTSTDKVIASGESSSLKLTDAMASTIVGKKLYVVAEGTGVYNGKVTSGTTGAVVTNKKITAVALNTSTPVVDDTLSVTITPKALNGNAIKNNFTYVWEIGTEKSIGGPTYTVEADDLGKQIRVHVISTGSYSGEAYSAYTSAVVNSVKITGVKITNSITSANAVTTAAEVGHTLKATVEPAQANSFVTYTWKGANGTSTGNTYVVSPQDAGKTIKVTVTTNSSHYKIDKNITISATTAKVVNPAAVYTTLDIPAPEPGKKPVTSVKAVQKNKTTVSHTASISWIDQSTGAAASFDQYGNFEPNKAYTAKVTITPASNYTLFGATVNLKSGGVFTQNKAGGNAFTYKFPSTGVQQVSDYYISDLELPVATASGYEYDYICGNDQVYAEAAWTKSTDGVHTATIKLYPKPGYTLNGLTENIFKVSGANSTKYAAGSDVVTATFSLKHELVLTANKTEVYQDGTSEQIVHIVPALSNYSGTIPNVSWKVINPTTDATKIDQNGQLVVGRNEYTDRSLVVEASVKIGSKTLTKQIEIPIKSGSESDTALKVVFTQAPIDLVAGKSYTYEAFVANSIQGCEYVALGAGGYEKHLAGGKWDLKAEGIQAGNYVIKAISNEDHSVTGSLAVAVSAAISIDSTVPTTLRLGTSTDIDATVEGSTNTNYTVYIDGSKISGKTLTASASKYEIGDLITVKVVAAADSSVTATKTILVVEHPTISIIDAPAVLPINSNPVTIQAIVTGLNNTDYTLELGGLAINSRVLDISKFTVNVGDSYELKAIASGDKTIVDSVVIKIGDDDVEIKLNVDKRISQENGPYQVKATVTGSKVDPEKYTLYVDHVKMSGHSFDPAGYEGEVDITVELDKYPGVKDSAKVFVFKPAAIAMSVNDEYDWSYGEFTPAVTVVGTDLTDKSYTLYANGAELTGNKLNTKNYNVGDVIELKAVVNQDETVVDTKTIKITGEKKIEILSDYQKLPIDAGVVEIKAVVTGLADSSYQIWLAGSPLEGNKLDVAAKGVGTYAIGAVANGDDKVTFTGSCEIYEEALKITIDALPEEIAWGAEPLTLSATVVGTGIENKGYRIGINKSGTFTELADKKLDPSKFNAGDTVTIQAICDHNNAVYQSKTIKITGEQSIKLIGDYKKFESNAGVVTFEAVVTGLADTSYEIWFNGSVLTDGKLDVSTVADGKYPIAARAKGNTSITVTDECAIFTILSKITIDNLPAEIAWDAEDLVITATVEGTKLTDKTYKVGVNKGGSFTALPDNTLDPSKFNAGETVTIQAICNGNNAVYNSKTIKITGEKSIKLIGDYKKIESNAGVVTFEAVVTGLADPTYQVWFDGSSLPGNKLDVSLAPDGDYLISVVANGNSSINFTDHCKIYTTPSKVTIDNLPSEIAWDADGFVITAKVEGTNLTDKSYTVYIKNGSSPFIALSDNKLIPKKYSVGDVLTIRARSNEDGTVHDTKTIEITGTASIELKPYYSSYMPLDDYTYVFYGEVEGQASDAYQIDIKINGSSIGKNSVNPAKDGCKVGDTIVVTITSTINPALTKSQTFTVIAPDSHGIDLGMGLVGEDLLDMPVVGDLSESTEKATIKFSSDGFTSKLPLGTSGDYAATVSNYKEDGSYTLYINGAAKSGSTLFHASVEKYKVGDQVEIVAVSNEDAEVRTSVTVTIIEAVSYDVGMGIATTDMDDLDDPYANVLSGLDANITITGGDDEVTTEDETTTEGEDAAEGEAATEGEAAAEGEAATEGEAAAEGEAATEGEAAAEGEAATEGEAAAEGEAATEGEAAAEGEAATEGETAAEGEAATEGETAAEGEAATEGEAAAEGEAATEGEAAAEGEASTEDEDSSIVITNADGSTETIVIIEEEDETDEGDSSVADETADEAKEDAAKQTSEETSKPSEKKTETSTPDASEDEDVVLTEEELAELEAKAEGESAAEESEAAIRVSIVKKSGKIARGNYTTFEAKVTGSEKGVRWSLYRSVEGASSINQDGKLTVGSNEKAEKLTIVAISREDNTVRAYCSVEVVAPSASEKQDKTESAPAETKPAAMETTETTDKNTSTETKPADTTSKTETTDTTKTESSTTATEMGESGPSAADMEAIWKALKEEEERQNQEKNEVFDLMD